MIFFLKKGVKLKKPYQTCSPLEVAGWEKKESKKLLKKHQETLSLESQKLKWKGKKMDEDHHRKHLFEPNKPSWTVPSFEHATPPNDFEIFSCQISSLSKSLPCFHTWIILTQIGRKRNKY